MSRIGRVLSASSSTVNWIDPLIEFKQAWKNCSRSHQCLIHILFQMGMRTLSSTSSVTRLATVTDTREPMAVTNIC